MVFESLKTKFLQGQLKRALATEKVETAKVKSKVAKIVKFETEMNKLKSQIAKAKKLNLTPAEKKVLQKRLDAKKKQVEAFKKGVKTGVALFAKGLTAVGDHLKEVEKRNKSLSRKPIKRAVVKKIVKKAVKRRIKKKKGLLKIPKKKGKLKNIPKRKGKLRQV